MPTHAPGLSKSRIVSGLQCARRLWLETRRRDLLHVDAATQAVFDAGNQVGELARELYGPGLLIGHVEDIDQALADTAAALAQKGKRQPLFEAAFRYDGVLVRADVLKPVRGGYDLIEVKSTTSVKDYQLTDCAIQTWVIRQTGLPLRRVRLAHVDSGFVYAGDGDYCGLLVAEDVTDAVENLLDEVPRWVRRFQRVVRAGEPDIATGPQCFDPFSCPFYAYCRAQEPAGPKYPVSILPRAGKLVQALQQEGYADLRKVPATRLDNAIHQRVRKASLTGRPFLDPVAAERIAEFGYPRFHLDFETIGFVVPRWAGTRPYQQVPFQWSCHVEQRNGTLSEHAFLDLSGNAPMRAFAESLLHTLRQRGPIFVYNESFESSRIRELAEMFPDLADGLLALTERIEDLLPLTRKHYYHPAMHGSWSIKAVLPTIAPELGYDQLEDVADGGQAQLAYQEAIAANTTRARRQALDKALRRYCGRDTLALVRLSHALAGE